MSNRPPGTYKRRYVDTTASSTAGSTSWPQSGGSPAPLANIVSLGATLHLLGIYFESAGTFVSKPSEVPAGETPANLTQQIAAPTWIDDVPQSIDPSTTALPFVLYYGPLGSGAR